MEKEALAKRNRELRNEQKKTIQAERDWKKKHMHDELDNTLDSAISKQFTSRGGHSGKAWCCGIGEGKWSHGKDSRDD